MTLVSDHESAGRPTENGSSTRPAAVGASAGPASTRAASASDGTPTGEPGLAELYLRTAHRIRRRSAPSYDQFGLTEAQARALRVISRYERPRMADLAQALEVVPRSITSMVDTLEAAGFVARQNDPTDRRATIVVLTDAGQDVLSRVGRMRAEAAEQLFAKLGDAEQGELRRILEVLDAGEEPLPPRRGVLGGGAPRPAGQQAGPQQPGT
ncbi:MAG TPA: MarR family transcriptional regulator, partial [Actinospica sp.]|nr:MarR family transcriptional regulator [Actinospica sp.]